MRSRFCKVFLVVFGFFVSSHNLANEKQYQIHVAPHGSWVKPQSVPLIDSIPHDKINNGIYYLLVDDQVYVPKQGKNIFYSHYAEKVVNQTGLQDSSQININYDPTYQSLAFHTLRIHRDGKTIDALPSIKYSELQREQELENALYDGSLTANIIISDLRVDDVVEYSYSITGDNPIHAGAFYYRFYTQWTVTLRQLYFRLLWERENSPYFREHNSKLKPDVHQLGSAREYIYQLADTEPLQTNNQTPSWYNPYGRVEISDVKQWSDVVVWAQALYDGAIESDSTIDQLVVDIQQKHHSKEEQIAAALDIVQSQVRYLGIETGVNSHKPSKAGETWQRRYGDCKDKTVLFIALLRKLGITAHPALVDTDYKQEIIHHLPAATVFNHVITKVELGGKHYWLDPTRRHQKSSLEDIYQPDYGYALVVAPGESVLTPMTQKRISAQIVDEKLDLSGDVTEPASYRVTTGYLGAQAESQRGNAAENNIASTTDNYINFYKDYYPNIKTAAPIKHQDFPETGRFQIEENYVIPDIWQTSESNSQKKYASVYASIIESSLPKPDELHRNSPFALRYPNSVTQKIQVTVGGDWDFQQEVVVEDNEFFRYSSDIKFDAKNNILNLIYRYESKQDHVPAEKIDTYLKARKKVMADITYNIYLPASGSVKSFNYMDHIYWIFIAVYLILLSLFVVIWYKDKKRLSQNEEAIFFPVSKLKFIVMSGLTFGIYISYWFWRNWIYVKRRDRSEILPFARAFFSGLWYYPFYKTLVSSESIQSQRYLPVSTVLAAVLAFFFLVASVASGRAPAIYDIVAIAVCILLVLPLVIQINKIPQTNDNAYVYNSRFRWRHLILVLLFVPLMLFYVAMEVGLIANTKVIDGSKLWSGHVKFMQQKGIITENENIQLFYSSAAYDVREDGNGFTESRVFSYWKEDGQLKYESSLLTEIDKIELTSQNAEGSSDAVVEIHTGDDSSFILYLSREDNGHKKFYDQLQKIWARENAKSELKTAFPSVEDRIKYKKNNIYPVVEQLIHLMYGSDKSGARSFALARLYENGSAVAKSDERAVHFYSRAYDAGHLDAGVRLAWLLSVSSDEDLHEPKRAKEIMRAILKKQNTPANREVLAAAYAANGEFEKSVKAQAQALERLKGGAAKRAQERLTSYQSNRAWLQPLDTVVVETGAMPFLKNPPLYPAKALKEKQEGIVLVEYDVTEMGVTTNIKVISAEPEGYFDEAAIQAAQKFKYVPSIENGVPKITYGVKNRFTFELEN